MSEAKEFPSKEKELNRSIKMVKGTNASNGIPFWLVKHIVRDICKVDQAELESMPNKTEDCINLL
eukprot:3570909-Lingulodinium_polyedra.AAC.1